MTTSLENLVQYGSESISGSSSRTKQVSTMQLQKEAQQLLTSYKLISLNTLAV